MSLETVTVRIPTELSVVDNPDAVASNNGGETTIPARAKLLPLPPLHHVLSGGASHLGVPPAAAENIEPGDLVACPDPYGQPTTMVFEVLELLGPWAEKFQLPEGADDPCPGWITLAAIPARDHMTLSRYAAERGPKIDEMNRLHANIRVREQIRREAAECAEIVAKLKSVVDPEPAVRALKDVLDDDGRRALLDALQVEREAGEQEAPVAA